MRADSRESVEVELTKCESEAIPSATAKRSLFMAFLFLSFACVRAIHPVIITASKSKLPSGETFYAYQSASTIILSPFLICICSLLVCLSSNGFKAWKSIFMPAPMLIFGLNGVLLAIGDWLEMESLSKMHGAPYQILTQSKIIFTALFMMPFKGVYQTRMQWTLLIALMFAMSTYITAHTSDSGTSSYIPFSAYLLTLIKVICSCLDAVYTDKYAKDYADSAPLTVQLVQTFFANTIVLTIFMSCRTSLWSTGFFHGWDALTVGVTASFCVKSTFTYIIVALLDAILKNLAECVAVLLVYFYCVFSPWDDSEFNLLTFNAVMVIIFVIGAYIESKKMAEQARSLPAPDHK